MAPFFTGTDMLLSFALYRTFAPPGVSLPIFGTFMGSAMSITEFPVLARIVIEQNILHTTLGTITIACAAANDVMGWCVLVYSSVLSHAARVGLMPVWSTLLGLAASPYAEEASRTVFPYR
jgi:Kef-type K+ transport system membrane component KefB